MANEKIEKIKQLREKEESPLRRRWILRCMNKWDAWEDMDDRMLDLSPVESIEQFWALHAYLKRPQDLPVTSGYFMFEEGFPTDADPRNLKGGRVVSRWSKKNDKISVSKLWYDASAAVVGEQFKDFSELICGVSISVLKDEYELSLWTSNSSNDVMNLMIKRGFEGLLCGAGAKDVFFERKQSNISHSQITSTSLVLVIHKLDPRFFNCDMIYNLFSVYGVCVRVFFLIGNQMTECYVEMGNSLDTRSAMLSLDGCLISGKPFNISLSYFRLHVYEPRGQPRKMPDGSPAFKNFVSQSKNLSVSRSAVPGGGRPTNKLHIHGLPVNATNENLAEMFRAVPFDSFIRRCDDDPCVTFSSVEEAIKAVMRCNNFKAKASDGKMIVVKLYWNAKE